MAFNFLKSLSGNFDLMRIGGASALIIYPAPYLWNAFAHGNVPEPAAFGGGYALVIGAVAAAIGGKEIALAKANATTTQSQGANP
jgi:hypothetical protein